VNDYHEPPPFKALHADDITLRLIEPENIDAIHAMLRGLPDEHDMIAELAENYMPQFHNGRRTQFGFYAMMDGELAGFSLLSIEDFSERKGSTGADTLLHMRGRGVAPRSKQHLFYFGFEMLNLHRMETGHRVSNIASQRSIQKTPGFVLEGRSRESGINDEGVFEDELLYGILKREWEELYDKSKVVVEF
jgi:RimJ/RimL family protein N-acetyltransferase